MFVLLLLASRAAGEWVEIAQHQHRQEPSRRTPSTSTYDGANNTNSIYANSSLAEHQWQWHRTGLARNPNFGSVKRVQLKNKDKDLFSGGSLSESTLAERIPNKNRRYENLDSVRAPNIKINEDVERDNARRSSNVDDGMNNYSEKNNETSYRFRKPLRYFDLRTETSSNRPAMFKDKAHTSEIIKFQEIVKPNDNDHIKINDKPLNINPNTKFHNTKGMQSGKEAHVDINIFFKESENNSNGKITNITVKPSLKDPSARTRNPYTSKTDIKDIFTYTSDKQADDQIELNKSTESFQLKLNNSQKSIKNKSNNNSVQNEIRREHVDLGDNIETNPVDVIWKLMKIVTDNISRNTRRSFRSKIRYLQTLRNNILANIEERIDQAWPDDATAEAGAAADLRGAKSKRSARAHVEFPSSESALMTISFLTFAVFLIKLVLQVIHTYKNKTMMVTPAVVAAVGRAAASLREHIRH